MKIGSLIIGIILTAIALSMMFFPIDIPILGYNVLDLGVLALGILFVIFGMKKRRNVEYSGDLKELSYGRIRSTGKRYGLIFLGIILVVIGLNLMFSFFSFDLIGYSINALVLLAFGIIMLIKGFRKNIGHGSKAHKKYLMARGTTQLIKRHKKDAA